MKLRVWFWLLALPVLSAQNPPQPPKDQPSEKMPVFGTTVVATVGLEGKIYHLPEDTLWLPKFEKLKPQGTIYTPTLNIEPQAFNQGFKGITDRVQFFGIEYKGRFWIEKPGKYRFALTSDDGSKLYIDNKQVIDNDGTHPSETQTKTVTLKAGAHDIRVGYFQGPPDMVSLVLMVAGPGEEEFRVFSTDEFRPPEPGSKPELKTP